MIVNFSPERGRFEITPGSSQGESSLIKAGWSLDKRRFVCYVRSPEMLRGISDMASFAPEVAKRFRSHEIAIAFSHAASGDNLSIPCPEGCNYYNFQEIGVVYAMQRAKTLIGDQPGLGKTKQAMGVINASPDINNILIAMPSLLKKNWVRELEGWLTRDLTIGVADTTYLPRTNIVICGYDSMRKLRPEFDRRCRELDKKHFDMLIADESQYLKNPNAQRTKAIFGSVFRNKIVDAPLVFEKEIYLSGTPMVNKPRDMWGLIARCDPNDLGAVKTHFGIRYCQGWQAPWGFDDSGASNLTELKNRLRGTFMIRRLKKDVLHDLPSKVRRIVVLRPNKEAEAALRKERELFELNIKVINKAIDKAEASVREDEEVAYKEDALGMKLGAIAKDARGKDLPLFEQLSTLRAELAIAKAPLMVTYAKLRLEEHDKIVIFAHHKSLQLALMNGLQQCNIVTILGSDSEDARDLAVYRFQHDPKVRVAICALTLAVGITLTKARYAFLAELDWRPSVNEQAEDRLHRITQEREVLIEHVVLDGSTDALMVKRIIKKMENIEAALD